MPHIHFSRRSLIQAAALAALAPARAAWAQTAWPTKPVRLVVPQPPGGSTDAIGRLLAEKLTESLGQTVFVDNRGGATGTIGADFVAKAPPDGYTLLFNAGSIAVAASMYPNLPYDLAKDFAPVTMVASQPNVVAVHPSVPVKTVAELIAWIKANPGKVNYGSAGYGAATHLAPELFKYQAKVDMQHIPFKGGGPALLAAVAGDVQVTFATASEALAQAQAGKLRLLAITSSGRSRVPLLSSLPTVSESGVPGYEFTTWYGVWATAGVPRPVVEKLNSHVVKILGLPEVKERFARLSLEPVTSTPAEFDAMVKKNIEVWANVVRAANIKPE